jgi:cell division septation protein DedD
MSPEEKQWRDFAQSEAVRLRAAVGGQEEYVQSLADAVHAMLEVMVPDARDRVATLGAMFEEILVALPRPVRLHVTKSVAEQLVRRVRIRSGH